MMRNMRKEKMKDRRHLLLMMMVMAIETREERSGKMREVMRKIKKRKRKGRMLM